MTNKPGYYVDSAGTYALFSLPSDERLYRCGTGGQYTPYVPTKRNPRRATRTEIEAFREGIERHFKLKEEKRIKVDFGQEMKIRRRK